MTYSLYNIVAIYNLKNGKETKSLFFNYSSWNSTLKYAYDYLVTPHVGHSLDFLVALFFYLFLFPSLMQDAATLKFGWISTVVFYNLACEFVFYGFWHYITYMSNFVSKTKKFNPINPYKIKSEHLNREIFLTTLGWLQSSLFQIVMMHLWASGRVPYVKNFFESPFTNIFLDLFHYVLERISFLLVSQNDASLDKR